MQLDLQMAHPRMSEFLNCTLETESQGQTKNVSRSGLPEAQYLHILFHRKWEGGREGKVTFLQL